MAFWKTQTPWLIHDYFFGKTLDKVRPGGIVAFITSKGTMDKENSAVRRYLAQRADLIGAIRLPNNAFKRNAGTEVTSDILFLQKRDRMTDIEPDWVHLDTDPNGIRMNSYFVQNPDMILGKMVMESTRFGMDSVCRGDENADLSELLQSAIQNLHAEITEYQHEELEKEDNSIPADPNVRNFSFCLVDGKVYFRENSRMNPVEVSVTAENRIRGMIALRDCVRRLIDYQTEGYPDEDIQREQRNLNTLYDEYTKEYGLLSSRGNSLAFGEDSSYFLLCSLEVLDEEGNFKRKADMFTKRTIRPHVAVTSVDTASEALAVSIAEKVRVDMPFMAELSGKTEAELEAELAGVIFRDVNCAERKEEIPVAFVDLERYNFVTADEYLSGNVRRKLRMVKALQEVLPPEKKELLARNIEALTAVQPVDLTAGEIGVRIGVNWVPKEIYEQFLYEVIGTSAYARDKIHVLYSPHSGEWNVTNKSFDGSNIKAVTTYGTKRINAYHIFEQTLNQKDARIYDTKIDANGNEVRVLNKKETAIAQDRQELIKAKFAEWVWKDIDRRERLCGIYNETFNAIRPREYDGQHIRFSGMNPEITLRKHQINAIAHIMYGGNTLLAHEVGAGKTFEIVAAAMESKRLGLCTKSLIVVPNHITEQWAAEWLQDKLIALHDADCPWRPSDLAQRLGRIVRQGNQNPEVEIFRYVTENTFDAYLYQLVENKQKFIAQIMTSKAPARIADDVDETALSYSEIKALATGNPLIIEKCNLDVEVSKLNMLKANHLNQRFALENMVLRKYPADIAKLTEAIAGYEKDVATAQAHPKPAEGFVGMEVMGTHYSEKEAAGKAVIRACTELQGADPIPLGQYRGFSMSLQYDAAHTDYKLTMKGAMSHTISLGADVFGNITRMDNLVDGLSKGLAEYQAALQDTRTQLANAKAEMETPFAKETELAEKSARLKELNILLNMDQKDKTLLDDALEQDSTDREQPRSMER